MARNDITGDTIANTKGSAEKYAQGWDAIFAPKKTGDESSWLGVWHFMVEDSCAKPMMVEPAFIESSFGKSYDSFTQPFNSFTMPPAGPSHSGMALDFHDRLKPGANFFPNNTVFADNNGNAIMSSGSIPFYQDPSHNG